MLNSTNYHKNKVYNDYCKRLEIILIKMKECKSDIKINFNICPIRNYENDILINSFNKMKEDYFNKKCSYKNGTLFDICLRNNINHFRLVFSNPGTRNILKSLYFYLNNLPSQLLIKNNLENDNFINCYLRFYINLFFCYDFITVLLENYIKCDNIDKMNCLEIIINDLIFILENNFK